MMRSCQGLISAIRDREVAVLSAYASQQGILQTTHSITLFYKEKALQVSLHSLLVMSSISIIYGVGFCVSFWSCRRLCMTARDGVATTSGLTLFLEFLATGSCDIRRRLLPLKLFRSVLSKAEFECGFPNIPLHATTATALARKPALAPKVYPRPAIIKSHGKHGYSRPFGVITNVGRIVPTRGL